MMCIVRFLYCIDAFKPVQNLIEKFNKISLLRLSQNDYHDYHSSQYRFNPNHKLNISGVWLFVNYLEGIIL